MKVNHVHRSVLIWRIVLLCIVLFPFLTLNDKEAKPKWNVWETQEVFAQAEATYTLDKLEALGRLPQTTVPNIKRKSDIKRLIVFSVAICLSLHPLLWLILFLMYPVSRRITLLLSDEVSQAPQLQERTQEKLEDAKEIETVEMKVFYTYKGIVRLEKVLNS